MFRVRYFLDLVSVSFTEEKTFEIGEGVISRWKQCCLKAAERISLGFCCGFPYSIFPTLSYLFMSFTSGAVWILILLWGALWGCNKKSLIYCLFLLLYFPNRSCSNLLGRFETNCIRIVSYYLHIAVVLVWHRTTAVTRRHTRTKEGSAVLQINRGD